MRDPTHPRHPATGLSHRTAVVAVPPDELWPPIQAIRRRHDRKVDRWMPHVTLLYPFRPAGELADAARLLAPVCAALEPFEVTLSRIRWFRHRNDRHTLWLEPEPPDAFRRLHAALLAAVPECEDTARHPGGFTPHLSLGQAGGRRRALELVRALQERWSPLRWRVREVALIAREGDAPFRIVHRLALGRTATS